MQELPVGTELGGFRIERVIARGSTSIVYEATQRGLDRRVALKVLARGAAAPPAPEHPNIVAILLAGTSERGDFVAMQLVRDGRTLADRLRKGRVGARERRVILADVAAALDAAHAEGLVHGAVAADAVLLDPDGRALLSGFRAGDDAQADRDALAGLARSIVPSRRDQARVLLAVGAGAAAVVGVFVFRAGEERPPAPLQGAAVLGSALSPGSVVSLDCLGVAPSGTSPACGVAQTVLAGRPTGARRPGVIRRWAVRGARGELALAVVRRHGGAFLTVARTQYSNVLDGRVHTFPANLPVRPGDLVVLEIAPGAAIGVRRLATGARTVRWFGPLHYDVRPPERGAGTGFDYELLLRVEYVPGANLRIEGELKGDAAAAASPGRVVRGFVVQSAGQRFVVARIGRRVVVDLFAGSRRVARLPLPGADAAGELGALDIARLRLGVPVVIVTWQNADIVVKHDFVVRRGSLSLLD